MSNASEVEMHADVDVEISRRAKHALGSRRQLYFR